MGKQVAATSRRKPTTMDVTFHDREERCEVTFWLVKLMMRVAKP